MSDKISEVTQGIVDLLINHWDEIPTATKDDIYYGDEDRYARFPSVGVEPMEHRSEFYQTGIQLMNTFEIHILVFHTHIQSPSMTKKERDEQAETVKAILHTDRKLGGLVVHGHVNLIEPGRAERAGALLYVSRLTWQGTSRSQVA